MVKTNVWLFCNVLNITFLIALCYCLVLLSKMYEYITNEAKQDWNMHIRWLENITALPVKCITFMGLWN